MIMNPEIPMKSRVMWGKCSHGGGAAQKSSVMTWKHFTPGRAAWEMGGETLAGGDPLPAQDWLPEDGPSEELLDSAVTWTVPCISSRLTDRELLRVRTAAAFCLEGLQPGRGGYKQLSPASCRLACAVLAAGEGPNGGESPDVRGFTDNMGSSQRPGHMVRQESRGKLAYHKAAHAGRGPMEISMGTWGVRSGRHTLRGTACQGELLCHQQETEAANDHVAVPGGKALITAGR